MKALLPIFCRPLGYLILLVSLFAPFVLILQGVLNDTNLIFMRECFKLLMMCACLMILLALSKQENHDTEQVRITALRRSVVITFIFIFGTMLFRVGGGDIQSVDTSSFLTFLIINVICLEFGLKKRAIEQQLKS